MWEADTIYKNMNCREAKKIIGNRAKWEVEAMKKALSKLRAMNTIEEEKRLRACIIWLKCSQIKVKAHKRRRQK